MMRLPNLLAYRHGRAAAFFLLYMTEGIPQGFATMVVATHLRRIGIGPAEIGATLGLIMLPWAFKWAYGPLIDVLGSARRGRRRGWILFTQTMMALTLLALPALELPTQLGLFSAVLFVHNLFGAMQDVAIDGLACNSLQENERAFAAGLMFAGQSLGMLIGGSGALFLTAWVGFQPIALFVALSIALVTLFVVLPMREMTAVEAPIPVIGSKITAAGREMRRFAVEAFGAFLGSRRAFGGLLFGLLPIAAMSLSLSLQSSLAVDLGLANDEVAWLGTGSSLLTAVSCVIGGFLSDRLDRRRALAVYIVLMSLPVLYLMFALQQHGWVMPSSGRQAPAELVRAFWIATLTYHLANGLIYGARAALFMDVTKPTVAATQFAVFMALTNLSIAYSSVWQGIAVESWGYPRTLLVDALFGLSSMIFLPMMRKAGPADTDQHAALRARRVALVLGLGCWAWLPFHHAGASLGAGQAIASLLFTVIFVASALFLLVASASLARTRLTPWLPLLALALLLMHARQRLETMAGGPLLLDLIPLLGGALLLLLSVQRWDSLARVAPSTTDPQAA